MKEIFLTSLLALLSISVLAQDEGGLHPGLIKNRTDSLEISFIDLRANSFLYREVRRFIQEQSDSSALFRDGFGFVTIDRLKLSPPGPIPIQETEKHAKEVVASVTLTTWSYPLSDESSLTRFPSYYSIVDGRLVLVYNELLEWISPPLYTYASRIRVEKLVTNTLQMALDPDFVFQSLQGKSYKLSKEQRETMSEYDILKNATFTGGGYKRVIKYFDGSVAYSK
ncbi:hypothetical protein [Telluribacter sp.]|jgi:hypothetical protein|uniref:hypothetical protein n=1 Tax=Telluribacter sp. TaxID=1978767 RepID=UPI002E13BA1E|nr:hypothetical protein [Telluribacter sp.]